MRLRVLAGYRHGQLVARAAGRLQRRRPGPLELPQAAPPLDDEAVRRLGGAALADLRDDERSDPAAPVLVAGVEVDPEQPWQPAPGATALSAFTLHYHAWLVPLAAGGEAARQRAWSALSAWLAAFPPSRAGLDLAWHPYVVSTRVRAWSALLAAEPPPDLALALAQALWQGLVLVEAHPEHDVAGNHLLRNETALAAGAALFAGAEARAVQRGAEQRVLSLLQDQFRPDGSHVERSTAYQAEAASDLLDVYAASHDPLETEPAANAAEAALGWLAHVSPAYQPRPALNDAPPELGPSTASLLARAAALGLEPFRDLPAKTAPRYVVLGDERTRLLVDFDQPSRPDLPYHAHADSLGIHVTVDGVPVIVERGTGTYEPGPGRAWWRSTAAHSTVLPAGQDTSEVVGAFRAGRLAHTTVIDRGRGGTLARHDGAGRPQLAAARRVRADGPASWTVWDAPAAPASAVARFHLPPGSPGGARRHGRARARRRRRGRRVVPRRRGACPSRRRRTRSRWSTSSRRRRSTSRSPARRSRRASGPRAAKDPGPVRRGS